MLTCLGNAVDRKVLLARRYVNQTNTYKGLAPERFYTETASLNAFKTWVCLHFSSRCVSAAQAARTLLC